MGTPLGPKYIPYNYLHGPFGLFRESRNVCKRERALHAKYPQTQSQILFKEEKVCIASGNLRDEG